MEKLTAERGQVHNRYIHFYMDILIIAAMIPQGVPGKGRSCFEHHNSGKAGCLRIIGKIVLVNGVFNQFSGIL
jgi:hypothetical protein